MRRAALAWAGALATAGLLAAAGQGAAAAADPEKIASEACLKTAIATVDIVNCEVAEFEALERKLNGVYKVALAGLPADQRAKLVVAERLWVAFRDKDCDVFYGKETGTAASINAHGCLVEHDRARIDALKKLSPP